MSVLSMVLDIVIIIALGTAVFYAWRLSKQITRMHAEKKPFEVLIVSLNTAASRAEAAVSAMKSVAVSSGDGLQEKINAARGLSDELSIIVQAGDNLADRLGVLAEQSAKSIDKSSDMPQQETKPRTHAEQDLLEAVQARQKT